MKLKEIIVTSLLIVFIGNIADGLVTYYAVILKGFKEGNVLMEFLLNNNHIIYILVKFIVPSVLIYKVIKITNNTDIIIQTSEDKTTAVLGLFVLFFWVLFQWFIVFYWIFLLGA